MTDEAEKNMAVAFDNVAHIAAGIQGRKDAYVKRDPLSALFGSGDGSRTPFLEGMLSIGAGSSHLSICAGAESYSIGGTDCGHDWSRPSPLDGADSDATFTLDLGDHRGGVPVSASEIATLENAALVTSIPYGGPGGDDGEDGHRRLRAYVEGWITAHT
ncbi:hypothetical protein ACIQUM_07590 [Amycolatopsis azurea]|uniref:hypothetical protein n=1 Tax=Amycolatopsis azurea TaxID=36819 RepID=UPI00381E4203